MTREQKLLITNSIRCKRLRLDYTFQTFVRKIESQCVLNEIHEYQEDLVLGQLLE